MRVDPQLLPADAKPTRHVHPVSVLLWLRRLGARRRGRRNVRGAIIVMRVYGQTDAQQYNEHVGDRRCNLQSANLCPSRRACVRTRLRSTAASAAPPSVISACHATFRSCHRRREARRKRITHHNEMIGRRAAIATVILAPRSAHEAPFLDGVVHFCFCGRPTCLSLSIKVFYTPRSQLQLERAWPCPRFPCCVRPPARAYSYITRRGCCSVTSVSFRSRERISPRPVRRTSI
ncbi:hypothetical protein FA95DRAFT_614568 [Auriscalpium vulgare]|uniref:Uncharacterized protein n=1 Tax=Auriscalpium vulgare TaxID=40419 RepID=A0ACB8RDP7_9AGAM|nr:hypothetical protein FA95DRAFT_614568 [Auriscalpium vulgare]